jgi:hypothetical protein
MTGGPKQISGRCLCGAVTYHADAEPLLQGVCHCTDCQHQTGTAFSVFVGIPRTALTVEGDTLASFTAKGEEHGTDTERRFCSACGSPIVSFVEAVPDLAFLKVGTLDDASWVGPAIEIWSRSAQPWSPHFEGVARVERGPKSERSPAAG